MLQLRFSVLRPNPLMSFFDCPSLWLRLSSAQDSGGSNPMIRRITTLLSIVVCLLAFRAPAFAAANDCDRACLKTALEQYMTAITMHKPSAAPLFAGFRQTE